MKQLHRLLFSSSSPSSSSAPALEPGVNFCVKKMKHRRSIPTTHNTSTKAKLHFCFTHVLPESSFNSFVDTQTLALSFLSLSHVCLKTCSPVFFCPFQVPSAQDPTNPTVGCLLGQIAANLHRALNEFGE
jgi:hypothetical protein